jgi:hypothetical protein
MVNSKLHQSIIKKYTECWVPDAGSTESGRRIKSFRQSALLPKYIGMLSRMHKKSTPKKYDLMVILSGPEPQRGLLESI